MKCVDAEIFLNDFANDELDFALRQKIELHLQKCPFCQSEAEELKAINSLLKQLPPTMPSNQFDERMMQAFRTHQQKQTKLSFWTAVFANLSIPKPALAFGLLALAGVLLLAFQIGRLTAPKNEMTANQKISQTESFDNSPLVQIVEKRVEVPTIKTVEVPVYKEKIVNRVVYKNREVLKTIKISEPKETKAHKTNFDFQNTADIHSPKRSQIFTSVNLKDFQPVSEIKVRIKKRGGENED
jgi:hypothetical protein